MLPLVRFELVRALRNVKYLVFLVAVPVGFYLMWGRGSDAALVAMAVYAATGGALMAAGGGVADDRAQGWLRQLRVTPLSGARWLAGRVVLGVVMTLPGILAVCLAAVLVGHADLPPARWAALAGVLLAGSLPFCLLGLFLGLSLRGKTAQLGIVVVFFALAALGGVIGQGDLPGAWQRVRELTPSHSLLLYGGAAASGQGGRSAGLGQAGVLAAWTALAGAAVLARRRWSSDG